MGKIFGISDLPVSTIMTPFEPIQAPQVLPRILRSNKLNQASDKYIPESLKPMTKKFIDMRNGWGKLMKSFSKSLTKFTK